MPRVLYNLIPIADGGGLQNAASFMESLARSEDPLAGGEVLVRSGTGLVEHGESLGLRTTEGGGAIGRLRAEWNCRNQKDVCFTHFGPVPVGSPGRLTNVAGCAYGNIFHPEINFWEGYGRLERGKRRARDRIRFAGTAAADYWVFETSTLRDRAIELAGFPRERTVSVRMAPSSLVGPDRIDGELRARFDGLIPKGFRVLFLSGFRKHKRLAESAEIAAEISARTDRPFSFVFTLRPTDTNTAMVREAFELAGVGGHFATVGFTPLEAVPSLIDSCDAMACLSTLESFSNNFVEAWKMRRPLIVTDADWARGSCEDAAVYVDPEAPAESAERLLPLIENAAEADRVVEAGTAHLATFPTPDEKTAEYFTHIRRAVELGPLPKAVRRGFRYPKAA